MSNELRKVSVPLIRANNTPSLGNRLVNLDELQGRWDDMVPVTLLDHTSAAGDSAYTGSYIFPDNIKSGVWYFALTSPGGAGGGGGEAPGGGGGGGGAGCTAKVTLVGNLGGFRMDYRLEAPESGYAGGQSGNIDNGAHTRGPDSYIHIVDVATSTTVISMTCQKGQSGGQGDGVLGGGGTSNGGIQGAASTATVSINSAMQPSFLAVTQATFNGSDGSIGHNNGGDGGTAVPGPAYNATHVYADTSLGGGSAGGSGGVSGSAQNGQDGGPGAIRVILSPL